MEIVEFERFWPVPGTLYNGIPFFYIFGITPFFVAVFRFAMINGTNPKSVCVPHRADLIFLGVPLVTLVPTLKNSRTRVNR